MKIFIVKTTNIDLLLVGWRAEYPNLWERTTKCTDPHQ